MECPLCASVPVPTTIRGAHGGIDRPFTILMVSSKPLAGRGFGPWPQAAMPTTCHGHKAIGMGDGGNDGPATGPLWERPHQPPRAGGVCPPTIAGDGTDTGGMGNSSGAVCESHGAPR